MRRQEWLTIFGRALVFVLDTIPPPLTSFTNSSGKGCTSLFSSSSTIIQYAPVLAEMFQEISTSFDSSAVQEFDYIYADLTKVRELDLDKKKDEERGVKIRRRGKKGRRIGERMKRNVRVEKDKE